MDLSFQTKWAAKLFNSESKLRSEFGPRMAKKIMTRLLDLQAASSLADMKGLPGRCHELSEDRAGHFALDLVHQNALCFDQTTTRFR